MSFGLSTMQSSATAADSFDVVDPSSERIALKQDEFDLDLPVLVLSPQIQWSYGLLRADIEREQEIDLWGYFSPTLSDKDLRSHSLEEREELLETLEAFKTLDDNWDAFGSQRPSENTVDRAIYFIKALPVERRLPQVTIEGDGEVTFYWETLKAKIFLTIDDVSLHLLVKRRNERNIYIDDVRNPDNEIPLRILRHIPFSSL